MVDLADRKYWAFISYSHRDARWGDWLHKALETYRIPGRLVGTETRSGTVPRRLVPIFRDREELPTSADLGATIRSALEESRYLVVICSPAAAQSIWVNEEIKSFKALHGEDNILALIVDGEPNASDEADGDERECFPEALRFRVDEKGNTTADRTEPIAADIRDGKDGRANAKLKIVAGLAGVGFDDLKQREKRRRVARRMQIAAASLAAITVGAVTWYAWQQDIAVNKAEQDALVATSKFNEGLADEAIRMLLMSLPRTLGDDPGRETTVPLDALTRIRFESSAVSTFRKHDTSIYDAIFSPDGSYVVSGGSDEVLRFWDPSSGKELSARDEHQYVITSISFSPDGQRILTTSEDETARLWEAGTGEPQMVLEGHRGRVLFGEFSPDGKVIATASEDTTVRLWDSQTGRTLFELKGHGHDVLMTAFSPDGRFLASLAPLDQEHTVRVWDTRTGNQLFALADVETSSITYSADGQTILTASTDGTARLWNARTGNQILVLKGHQSWVEKAIFSPDGSRIATAAGDGTAIIWDVETGEELVVFEGHSNFITSVEFSADGRRLLTAAADDTARMWDTETGKELWVLRGREGGIEWAAFSPDESRILTVSDRNVSVWDARPKHEQAVTFDGDFVQDARLSNTGRQIVIADLDAAKVFDIGTKEQVLKLDFPEYRLKSAAFSPDSERIFTLTPDNLQVRDVAEGEPVFALAPSGDATSSQFMSAAFDHQGKYIATSVWNAFQIWSADSGEQIDVVTSEFGLGQIDSMDFSRDGRYLAFASNISTAYIWNIEEGSALALQGETCPCEAIAFSPDGGRVATASSIKVVRLWDASTGQEIIALNGHQNKVHSVDFSADGRFVLSASSESAKVWNAATGELVLSLSEPGLEIRSASFGVDESTILTVTYRTARIWRIPQPGQAIIDWAYRVLGVETKDELASLTP